jgi:hypothetical protein
MQAVRRNVWLWLPLVLLAGASAAQGQDWARKMFSDTSHDFGNVAKGSKAQYRFKVTNIYQEPLHIAGVRSSCGCTSAEATKTDLKTWETADVVANLNTNAFLGVHSATVTVTFDKPFAAEVQLQVSGNIHGDVVMQPGLVELGTIDAGQTAEKKISLTHTGSSDWTITDVRSANTNFEVEVNESYRKAGTVGYELVVRLKPTAPPGYLNDQLFLVTNDAEAPQIPVDVEGKVASEIEVAPTPLVFGSVAPGQSVTKNLVIRNTKNKPFKVLDVIGGEGISGKVPTEARAVQLIPITLTPGSQPGKVEKLIKIKTDLGDGAVPDVVCRATIVGNLETTGASSGAANITRRDPSTATAGYRGN